MAIALYARQSVERENSISCETQLEYCKSALRPDEREEELLTFIDSGYSGGNTDRNGFQDMLRQVRQRKIRKVIVYKLDRISRSLSDFVNILQEFKAHNVEFVSSQEAFDTSSPYGELVVKILMVFAEFERTSIINRITQAYAHRSEMGFYMGGRLPYGFELVPAVINGVTTKKLNPIPAEARQLKYIFEVYSRESVSLRSLLDALTAGDLHPLNGSAWTTAKLSALLKNPVYVKADSQVYDYFERRGVQMITDIGMFTGECGAQLYGRTKHNPEKGDWSDMKLVLLTHSGIIESETWLKCQRKLQRNKQLGNSLSNRTSWLSGKVYCEICGHGMTTVKGRANRAGEIRRYFNCTGKSHKRICTGIKTSMYAEDLENMVSDCISAKLSELSRAGRGQLRCDTAAINGLRLKIKEVDSAERRLVEHMLSGGLNDDLLELANHSASRLKADKAALIRRVEEEKSRCGETFTAINLMESWKSAGYALKKEIAMIIIQKITVSESGDIRIFWNI